MEKKMPKEVLWDLTDRKQYQSGANPHNS